MSQKVCISAVPTARGLTVRVAGRVDVTTVSEVAHYFRDLDEQVQVDLSDVTFIDASGLDCLAIAARRSRRRGHPFTITRASRDVLRNVTSLTGLDRLPVGIDEPRIAGAMRPLVA